MEAPVGRDTTPNVQHRSAKTEQKAVGGKFEKPNARMVGRGSDLHIAESSSKSHNCFGCLQFANVCI